MQSNKMRITLIGLVASLSLVAAACGADEETTTAASGDPTTTTEEDVTTTTEATDDEEMTDEEMTDEEMTDEEMEDEEMAVGDMTMASGPFGPGCASVPEDGDGSFAGMASDPAATAASSNPELSTLVDAVTQAGLVDTLNSEGPFTIFAPTNDAFGEIPAADMDAVMADEALLTDILTLHVHQGEALDAADLADMDTISTVNGEEITVSKSGDTLEINGQAAVVCGNVEVANGVVHIIDTVLMP